MNNRIDDMEVAHYEAILWGAALSIEDTEPDIRVENVPVTREAAEITYKEAILHYWETSRGPKELGDPANSPLESAMAYLWKSEKAFVAAYLSEEISRLDASHEQRGA